MIDKSLIQILNKNNDIVGTGFIISDHTAVTCAHVVNRAQTNKSKGIKIRFYSNNELQIATLDKGWSPAENDDVAFLKLKSIPTHSRPLLLASAFGCEGKDFISAGFIEIEKYNLFWVNGRIGGIATVDDNSKHPMIQLIGAQIKDGMSGAPIVMNQTGLVVGMVSEYINDKLHEYAWATTSDTIAELNPSARKSFSKTIVDVGLSTKRSHSITSDEIMVACQKQVDSALNGLRQKYDPGLYVNRVIESRINQFLDEGQYGDSKNCYLIIAPAGSGKTNLLCNLARERNTKQPVLFLTGGNIFLSENLGLVGSLKDELEYSNPNIVLDSPSASLHILHRLALSTATYSVLIIDAINEYESPLLIKKAIKDILRKTSGMRIKILISCRDYYWGVFEDEFWANYAYNATYKVDTFEAQLQEGDKLYLFDSAEQKKAISLYLERYEIQGEPVKSAREQCRHPLLLRFFCEAYRGQNIGDIEDIRLKELFDLYWEKKIESIAYRMIQQGFERRFKGLALRIEKYLRDFAMYMLENKTRSIQFDNLSLATGQTDKPDDPKSIYGRIRDEYIILEEIEKKGGDHSEYQVAFVYEEFMEYTMARSLLHEWEKLDLQDMQILSSIEILIDSYKDFAQILGCVVYLVIMVKEKRNIDVWSNLFSKGEKWQKVVFESIRKLPESELDLNVFSSLEQMILKNEDEITIKVLGLLSTNKLIKKIPESTIKVICNLVTTKSKTISELAIRCLGGCTHVNLALPVIIQILVRQDAWLVKEARRSLSTIVNSETYRKQLISLLLNYLRGDDVAVRRFSAKELAGLKSDLDVSQFLFALRDDDFLVRSLVAELLGNIGDRKSTDPLIKALKDKSVEVRCRVVEALGRIGDERSIPALLESLQDRQPQVRSYAAESLGIMRSKLAVGLLIQMLDDRSLQVKIRVAEALGRIGDESSAEQLVQQLQHKDPIVRSSVIKALGSLGTKKAVQPLVALIRTTQNSGEVLLALDAIGKSNNRNIYKVFKDLVKHKDTKLSPDFINKAAEIVNNVGSETEKREFLKIIFELIVDEDRHPEYIHSFLNFDISLSIGILLSLLQHDDYQIRKSAVKVLGQIRDPRVIRPLINSLRDRNAGVVRGAASSLSILRDVDINALIEAKNDLNPIVQYWVSEALVENGKKTSPS